MVQRTYAGATRARQSAEKPSWFDRTAGVLGHAVMPSEASWALGYGGNHGGRDGGAAWAARLGRLIPRLLLVVAVTLLVAAIGLFAFRATYAERVYPAVAVGDVAVGGMTAEQAVAAVEQRAATLERGTVTFTYGGQTWSPTLAELGASVNVASSVDAAWALGRDESAVARLGFAGELLQGDQRVPLRTTVDRAALAQWFASVNADINDPAVNAQLLVNGAEVTVTQEQAGTVVDEDAALNLILDTLRSLEPVATELPTQPDVPDIHAADLEQPRADLAAALNAPISVSFEGQRWDIPSADLTQFLTVETVYEGGAADVNLSFNHEALAGYLRDAFSGAVNRAPVDAQIAWSAEQNGLVALEPSVDGAALRSNAFADAVSASFLSDQAPVEIPVIVTKPEIDSNNLAALGIDGLLGRGDSNYDGGKPDRDKNIEVGVELMNGELVAPGEEFSFNGAVGEITYDKGFVDAGVIEAETIGRDVGGGICQVSTTVFRAALMSGMPITEWWPHSLRLRGYERDGWTAGFDASILQAGSNPEWWGDFKFKNDTDGYMLVHAWTDYPHVIVEVYGNDDGRSVDISEPRFWKPDGEYEDKEVVDPEKPAGYMEQTQWPTEPYAVAFTRTITYADGTSVDRVFESVYEGSGNVYRVSPDMKGKSPAANPDNGDDQAAD